MAYNLKLWKLWHFFVTKKIMFIDLWKKFSNFLLWQKLGWGSCPLCLRQLRVCTIVKSSIRSLYWRSPLSIPDRILQLKFLLVMTNNLKKWIYNGRIYKFFSKKSLFDFTLRSVTKSLFFFLFFLYSTAFNFFKSKLFTLGVIGPD